MESDKDIRHNAKLFDIIAEWIINTLKNRHSDSSPIRKVAIYIKYGTAILICLYSLFLLIIYAGMELIGIGWWFTAFLCYLPQTIWLIPIFILAPITFIFYRKLISILLISFAFVFIFMMKFNFSLFDKSQNTDIVLLTNNIGQDNKQSLSSFIKLEKPDILLLQEAGGRTRQFSNSFPEYYFSQCGEFGILSKFKIINSKLITSQEKNLIAVAARFEILISNQTIIVYNVHIPSPRYNLNKTAGKGLIIATIGTILPINKFGDYTKNIQEIWHQYSRYYEHLYTLVEKEEKPFIVAGDFNLPNRGPSYRLLCKNMKDSFKYCCTGFGYTFPGTTINPLSLFGPWIRIDYIFAGKGFTPIYAKVEPHRKSQHRAVVAGLKYNSQ